MTAVSLTGARERGGGRREAVIARMRAVQHWVAHADDGAERGAQERMQEIYDLHADALIRCLLHWTKGDRQVAEDLMQETMLRAWRNLDGLHADPVALRPWLTTVGRRVAIDALRARAVRPDETADDGAEGLCGHVEPYDRVLDRDAIGRLLAGLSVDHRTVLMHVYVHDLTVPQTARVLGIPEGTVKSRLHNALRAARAGCAVG